MTDVDTKYGNLTMKDNGIEITSAPDFIRATTSVVFDGRSHGCQVHSGGAFRFGTVVGNHVYYRIIGVTDNGAVLLMQRVEHP
jgi:hypothetical protein